MRDVHGRLTRRSIALLAVPAVAVGTFVFAGTALAPAAQSASTVGTVAAQLKEGPVYVDQRASGELSASQAGALAEKIEKADKPVFVAVLPAAPQFPAQSVLQDVRSTVGISGVYAIQLGERFNAGADPQVMSRDAVTNLTDQVQRSSSGRAAAKLDTFVDQALRQAAGKAPDSWSEGSNSGGGAGATTAITLGAIAIVVGGGGYAVFWRSRKVRAERERAGLEKVSKVVDEDITAFGEELDRLDFKPDDPSADDPMRGDYSHALDSYERAKGRMASARGPEDVKPVTESLEDGRFSLATLEARRNREPLPERRPPCFFDPRHGPSVGDVPWAPPGGATRDVPACAADTALVKDGRLPRSRTVDTDSGPQPYWNAGSMYGPYAGGYFGGGLLPGLLIGTLLASSFPSPGYGYGDDGYGGPDGGDYSGSDFDPGDFGGGGDGGFGGGGFE
jgi:hypothetical protein